MLEVSRGGASLTKTLLLAATVAMLLTACGDKEGAKSIRGLVTDVQARSITEVASITLQEEDTGKIWTFQAEEHIGFTPSHIREHMLQGQQVTVRYREEGGRLIAILVTD